MFDSLIVHRGQTCRGLDLEAMTKWDKGGQEAYRQPSGRPTRLVLPRGFLPSPSLAPKIQLPKAVRGDWPVTGRRDVAGVNASLITCSRLVEQEFPIRL